MTDEEMKELEALRAEKHSREQTERAKSALTAAGVPQSFAHLLVGSDDADTDQRVRDFCGAYQASLTEDIKKRLPEQPPTIAAPLPQRPRRGIQRLR